MQLHFAASFVLSLTGPHSARDASPLLSASPIVKPAVGSAFTFVAVEDSVATVRNMSTLCMILMHARFSAREQANGIRSLSSAETLVWAEIVRQVEAKTSYPLVGSLSSDACDALGLAITQVRRRCLDGSGMKGHTAFERRRSNPVMYRRGCMLASAVWLHVCPSVSEYMVAVERVH